jgi:hypothetical protein
MNKRPPMTGVFIGTYEVFPGEVDDWVAAKVHGACGYCGCVKIVPAHWSFNIDPEPVRTCDHG